jgi:hypothetical protein
MAAVSERTQHQRLAWQGWAIQIPADWNPVRIEGDFDRGSVLLADLASPKLAIRWRRPTTRSFDADRWALQALRDEVGRLAADESAPHAPREGSWRGARLYVEPDPPGRDVWVGHSTASDRLVEIVYHATMRDRVLSERVLPTLADQGRDDEADWSIFTLACRVPTGMRLHSQRLVAGDLRLRFTRRREWLVVRQIGVAQLALTRLPLDRWLAGQQWESRKHYRPLGAVEAADLDRLEAFSPRRRAMTLRRRWRWQWWRPRQVVSLAVHDTDRDRLLILEGSDEATLVCVLREMLEAGGSER